MSPSRSVSIRALELSTHTTEWPKSARQVPVTSPTYPVPTIATFMKAISPVIGERCRNHRRRRHRRPRAEQRGHRAEPEIGQQGAKACFGQVQIAVMAEASEPARLQPGLVGVDLPRVDVEHRRLLFGGIEPGD